MKTLQFGVAAVVVLAAVGFVYSRSSQPPEAEVVAATQSDVVASLAVSGVLESEDRTTLSSQLGGARIVDVLVDIGDTVQPGDPLIRFEDSEFVAQRLNAEGQIGQADASMSLQDVNAASAERSLAISRQSLEAVNELRQAVIQAETNLKTARQRLVQAEANSARVRAGGRDEQVKIAEAQLERAIALRNQRKREADRAAKLAAEGAISVSESELAQTALTTAEKEVQIARENVTLANRPRAEDVRQADAQVAEAREAVSGATSALRLAQTNLNDRLNQRLQVSQAESQRDSARAQREVSRAQRSTAEAQLRLAQSNLAKTVVRAPFAARVAERLVEPGQTVALGAPLLTLANENVLRVRLDVDEASLSRVRVGEKAVVGFDAFPDIRIDAEVSQVGSAANFERGTVEVRLRLKGTDPRLKPDLTADANIITAEYKNAVVVPRRALLNPDAKAQVLVSQGGQVQPRDVKWAPGDPERIVILEGLKVGEKVLLNPRATKPGQRIREIAPRQQASR